ncbi:2-hydroxyacid dehydrogenase [Pseudaquabacterium rugosum]|uniref:Glyoxylate/hydroxypyruvate reductase A n=1 Tax=Pseudaquabacterium rugosum TaxID=2984194 RepID=A0ABU9B9S0_9BURK
MPTDPLYILLAGQWTDAAEAARWQAELQPALAAALPQARLITQREAAPRPQDIAVVIAANPPPGSLHGLPGLRLIQSLWAGVDRLLADPDLPAGVPVARMVDPAMNAAMAETACWAVLGLHRGFFDYQAQQAAGRWQPLPQCRADEVPVLVLGAGQMGLTTARQLMALGYPVTVWGRAAGTQAAPAAEEKTTAAMHEACADAGPAEPSTMPAAPATPWTAAAPGTAQAPAPRRIDGRPALMAACAGARIVVNLLPLTPETRGLIDARLLAALPDGASVVNLARGAHVVDADLQAALDSGRLSRAVLDVFHQEPLPADHPWWRHPRITVLPHAAAQTDPRSASRIAAEQIADALAGRPLRHTVDRGRGY